MNRMKTRYPVKRVILFFVVALLIVSLGGGSLSEDIAVSTYRITSEKVSNATPIRIVLITDLHDRSFGGDQQPLLFLIQEAKPDMILLVGDMFNTRFKDQGAIQLLEGIGGLAPCFYVTGNHEINDSRQQALDTIAKYGVTALENTQINLHVNGQTIQLIGIDDPLYHRKKTMEQILQPLAGFDTGFFTILMSHRPEYIEQFSEYGFDLVVSGHTHGGQVRIPFLVNGLYAPGQGWFPKYAGGLYKVLDTTLIISRGLANDSKYPRIFNPPEVVVIDLLTAE